MALNSKEVGLSPIESFRFVRRLPFSWYNLLGKEVGWNLFYYTFLFPVKGNVSPFASLFYDVPFVVKEYYVRL